MIQLGSLPSSPVAPAAALGDGTAGSEESVGDILGVV
jgi:hypothetical protein